MPQYDPIPDAQLPEPRRRGSGIIAVVGVTGVAALAGFGLAVAAPQTPGASEPQPSTARSDTRTPSSAEHFPAERVTAGPVPPPPDATAEPPAPQRASRSAGGSGGSRSTGTSRGTGARPRAAKTTPSSADANRPSPKPSAPRRAAESGTPGKPPAGESARAEAPPPVPRKGAPGPYRRVPDPCATFYDFRRDYCYRVLDRLMSG